MPLLAQNIDAAPDPHCIAVGPGTLAIGGDGLDLMATLGAGLAICLHDGRRRLGGMIHIPETADGAPEMAVILKGIDRLADALTAHDLSPADLTANLCGAARLHLGMRDKGVDIAAGCRDHLMATGIDVGSVDLGGIRTRRIVFRPGLGRLDVTLLQDRSTAPAPGDGRSQRIF